MDIPTIKAAIESVMVTLSQLPPKNVQWRNKRRNAVSPTRTSAITTTKEPGAQLLMHISSTRSYGRDEYTIDDTGEYVEGPRGLALELQCRSFTQDDDVHAVRILERIRTLIKAPSILTTLREASLSIGDRGNVLDLSSSIPVDMRCYSLATLDVNLNASSCELIPADLNSGTIDSVEISGLDRSIIVERPD